MSILGVQTLVLPTQDTVMQLKEIMNYCPFPISWDTLHLELNVCSVDNVVSVEPNKVFEGTPINSNPEVAGRGLLTAYNPESESTSLYLPITSPELTKYAYKLRKQNGTLFHTIPLLYMVLVPYYHNSLLHNHFVNSVSDALVTNTPIFTFDAMMIRNVDWDGPNDTGYYEFNGLM